MSETIIEKNIASPIFLDEVYLFLKKRYKYSENESSENFSNSLHKKLMKFCVKMCFLEKKKIKELRDYINQNISKKSWNYEDQVQAEIILCKLIDLAPYSFKVAIILLPGYKKYFKTSEFRKHYKMINSFINS
jgi:hypothetical protein